MSLTVEGTRDGHPEIEQRNGPCCSCECSWLKNGSLFMNITPRRHLKHTWELNLEKHLFSETNNRALDMRFIDNMKGKVERSSRHSCICHNYLRNDKS